MAANDPHSKPQEKPQEMNQRPEKQPGKSAVDSPRQKPGMPGKSDQNKGRPETTEIESGEAQPSNRPGARGLERD